MTTLRDLPPEPRGGWMTKRWGAAIRERHGISAALIADELGLQERTVIMIQRKLGLRPCRQPGSHND